MFCPSCGKTVDEKLKYCNGCGERLTRQDDENSPSKMLDDILDTLFWFAVIGLGIMIGLVAVLLTKGLESQYVALIVVIYLLTIFGICFTLARQVPKLIDAKLNAWNRSTEPKAQPLLSPKSTAQLEEHREPAASVTELTTRSLDKVPVERS